MRMLVLMGVAVLMLRAMTTAASAAVDDTWALQLRASHDGLSVGTLTVGVKPGASDAYTTVAAEDATFPPTNLEGYGEIISTIVPGQRTSRDVRSPFRWLIPYVGWDLSLYIVGGAPGTIRLDGWMVGGTYELNWPTDGGRLPTLRLVQECGFVWQLPFDSSGSQAAPQWTHTLAYTGSPIRLHLGTVPEPSSVVALLSGIAGLAGLSIRRRK